MKGFSVLASGGRVGRMCRPPGPWQQTGDYNGDGKSDLFVARQCRATRAMWFMNGATIASTAGLRHHTDELDRTIAQRGVKAAKLVGVRFGSNRQRPAHDETAASPQLADATAESSGDRVGPDLDACAAAVNNNQCDPVPLQPTWRRGSVTRTREKNMV